MKKLFPILLACMTITFVSCEHSSTNNDPSPIKGVWECQQSYGKQILNFGEQNVEYSAYADYYNIGASYVGTYSIKNQIITLSFTSMTTTQSTHPKVEYLEPEKLPKEAILKDNNTISYSNQIFKRL